MGYVFISYSSKNRESADAIRNLFMENGIDTWMAPYDLTKDNHYIKVINQVIKDCACFLLILSQSAQQSSFVERELERAITYCKTIVPVQIEPVHLDGSFSFYLNTSQILTSDHMIPDASDADKLLRAVRTVLDREPVISDEEKEQSLYSQVLALQRGNAILFCEKLCELLALLTDKLKNADGGDAKVNTMLRISDLYKLYWKNGLGYGTEYREIAKRVIRTISSIDSTLNIDLVSSRKNLFAAAAIELIYYGREIEDECIDCYTTGDIHGRNLSAYIERQSPYIRYVLTSAFDDEYSEDELRFIAGAKGKILSESITIPKKSKKEGNVQSACTDERFEEIANYFSKGNEIFNCIGHDRNADELFNCLLMSYERLQNYCLEVGEKNVYGECVIKISELKQLMLHSQKEKNESSDAERGIKALLGLTLPKSGMYDVFISYKHYDEDRAQKVYGYLQRQLKETFFDKETLPELSKSDYEQAVMSALSSSKHFVVIVSDLNLLEKSEVDGDWVRREMRCFNSEIQEGRKKGSNFIILASDNVYDQILSANKSNIDIMWRWQEIIRFSEFESILKNYI